MIEIALIEKLVDRIIQAVNYRKEQKRKYFDEYISPLYEAFEKIHDSYLSAFKGYLAVIQEKNSDLPALVSAIESDRLFEDHTRRKILALTKVKPNDSVDRFLGLVQAYLVNPYLFLEFEDGHRANLPSLQQIEMQRWRGTLLEYLDRLENDKEGKEKANQYVFILVSQMQDIAGRISNEYVRIRSEFS